MYKKNKVQTQVFLVFFGGGGDVVFLYQDQQQYFTLTKQLNYQGRKKLDYIESNYKELVHRYINSLPLIATYFCEN